MSLTVGGEPNMRMRPHVHALAGDELNRAEMIEEDERTDHLSPPMRQCAAHGEAVAEIAGARHDDVLQRIAGGGIAEFGIDRWLPAHGTLQRCGRASLAALLRPRQGSRPQRAAI
ncbi:hypothetical protein ACVIJ6_002308 [Bradyrhizobium sp. USDA 4369]